MGHASKKKKKGGSRGRNKGKAQQKDHFSDAGVENELLSEEITALCAIFEEDCRVSGSPPQIIIKLKPHSKDMGYEDLDVSAFLSVRCLPGYPYKCPKLKITPEKGLTKGEADNLLCLLQDQANSNAREGRVMIFNLVEAAQEFLSEIVPVGQSHNSGLNSATDGHSQLLEGVVVTNNKGSSAGPFVYGFIDLFSGYGESRNWGFGLEEKRGRVSSVESQNIDGSNKGYEVPDKNANLLMVPDKKQGQLVAHTTKLVTVGEENEDENKSISACNSLQCRSREIIASMEGEDEDIPFGKYIIDGDTDDLESRQSEPSSMESLSPVSLGQGQPSQNVEKDLIMVHLLRLACASKGPLSDALPQIANELWSLGIFSKSMRDLASKPSSLFNKSFDRVFHQHMVSSRISEFWKPRLDIEGPSTSLPSSRYLSDFEELQPLGHGGFGHVVLCKNKLDGRQYAVKKIRLKDKNLPVNDRILREVATLSRLQHQHVVRYYQAWFETGVSLLDGDSFWGSVTPASATLSYNAPSLADLPGNEYQLKSTYLYIQMEYCPRTLRQVLESNYHFDKDIAWHLFRQIVEGLAHIHGQGIIHRDLTPNNIFFDARNDIKIGDFGLAKFLKLEHLDQDASFPTDTTGLSIDGTGQVGTYFYTAPEIEQGWPKIDEKVDMYSLGVVFFELWHPFGTAMERHIVLSDLKLKGEVPPAWRAEFPEQESLLRRLMSSSPSDRPSVPELLKHAFPPRMEYELLDDVLRMMQTTEDTSIYDKVVSSLFDEEMPGRKNHHQHGGVFRVTRDAISSIHYTDINSELRDYVTEVAREVFRLHCAKPLETIPMYLLGDCPQFNRLRLYQTHFFFQLCLDLLLVAYFFLSISFTFPWTRRNTVKLLTQGGDMLELCHELRLPFVCWVIANQKSSFKRYEISSVYRRAVGHSPPYSYLQGDFDIIGGASALTEAEILKVTLDIVTRFFHTESCDIHLNHADLLDAIWSWAGVKAEHRQKAAELLSMMGSSRPQSAERKSKWVFIRRQLLQELKLAEAVVNRLQTVGLRFCGAADQALPRLRGALPADKYTHKALNELTELFSYLREWRIEQNVYIDALMPPTESYHRDLFFQVFLLKENSSGSLHEGSLLAVGGRYDYLLRHMWDHKQRTNPPGAVGISLALETIIQLSPVDFKPVRSEATTSVLVCSRGGGGLLYERMELSAELWDANIKAQFVPVPDPSLTEQYEYASEHDIKFLVIITETGVSQTGFVKVRHFELKKEKEVQREGLVKFFTDATATHFRNPSFWI